MIVVFFERAPHPALTSSFHSSAQYNEKMSNREQHVSYLEENLVELQSSNRNMIFERQEAESNLREELDSLQVLVDAMTVPLWQFGESGVSGKTVASRIRMPVFGREFDLSEVINDASGENADESDGSYHEEDAEGLSEDESTSPEMSAPVQVCDASTQTNLPSGEAGVSAAAAPVAMPVADAPSVTALRNDTAGAPVVYPHESSGQSGSKASHTQPVKEEQERVGPDSISSRSRAGNKGIISTKSADVAPVRSVPDISLFRGGMHASVQPRRLVHKFGLVIRPGVLKESLSKVKPEKN